MNRRAWKFVLAFLTCTATVGRAEVKIEIGHSAEGDSFVFPNVAPPAVNDAAANADFRLVDGARDRNSGELAVLNDGRVPEADDSPADNFFFIAGSSGGRVVVDLKQVLSVKYVATYSWHAGTRAPQVYSLYASGGTAAEFEAGPKQGTDPTTRGWKSIVRVDTRMKGDGGQHAVAISDAAGAIGEFRYLLFEIDRTESQDAFGNTFISEIDVVDAKGPEIVSVASADTTPILKSFDTADGKYHFTIDATKSPDLIEWSEKSLKPVILEWYPKIVAMLPSDQFEPPTKLTLRFRNDMGSTPASAGGARINLNIRWFRGELKGEALGAVVHELVHVVQDYRSANRSRANRPPSWLVEGIADYIRWFLYEPQSQGAEITRRNITRAQFDSSYRVTGNFLNWVTLNHEEEIVKKLNAAARDGRYDEKLWKEFTGKTLQELGTDWKNYHEQRIAGGKE